jgi:hypothetical protein
VDPNAGSQPRRELLALRALDDLRDRERLLVRPLAMQERRRDPDFVRNLGDTDGHRRQSIEMNVHCQRERS